MVTGIYYIYISYIWDNEECKWSKGHTKRANNNIFNISYITDNVSYVIRHITRQCYYYHNFAIFLNENVISLHENVISLHTRLDGLLPMNEVFL